MLAQVRELGREIVGRFDEAFELGRQLLEPLRGGWLEALRTGVGIERVLVDWTFAGKSQIRLRGSAKLNP